MFKLYGIRIMSLQNANQDQATLPILFYKKKPNLAYGFARHKNGIKTTYFHIQKNYIYYSVEGTKI